MATPPPRGAPARGYPSSQGLSPLLRDRADPWIMRRGKRYWYCYSDGHDSIYIAYADRLEELADARSIRVWKAPPGHMYACETWAPELHFLDGRWYIYFAASDGRNENHRMYVLESASDEALGPYHLRGLISCPENRWAIDGTILEEADGRRYFLWSGWEGEENLAQNLYIAPLANPWSLSGPRVLLSQPLEGWERRGGPPYVNEGPQILRRGKALHIIYSASGSWCDDYCLGQLTWMGGDILDARSWRKQGPVFAKTAEVPGPGHACFLQSIDWSEDWMVYHAAQYPGAAWKRHVYAQRFAWDSEGQPLFGAPSAAEAGPWEGGHEVPLGKVSSP